MPFQRRSSRPICWHDSEENTPTNADAQCFFVTVRAGTAYRKIWRLVNNFFARTIRFTVQKFQLFWVIFCIIIFFIELWHILILWLAKMLNGGMPVFTLIATGWRYRKIFFYKKALQTPHQWNEIRHMVKYFWTLLSSRSSYVLVHWTLFAVYVLIFCAAIWRNKRRWQ